MHITMIAYRKPSQHVTIVLSTWAVGSGTRELARLDWDPGSPLERHEAVRECLERALAALGPRERRPGAEAGGKGWEDAPLPGMPS